jgi:integrase
MAKNDEKNMQMMENSWLSLLDAARKDPPPVITPEYARVLATLDGMLETGTGAGMPLSVAVEKFLEDRRSTGISESGFSGYRGILKEMVSIVGAEKAVRRLTVADVSPYKAHVQGNPEWAESTKKNKFVACATFFKWMRSEGLSAAALEDSFASVKIPKSATRKTSKNVSYEYDDLHPIYDLIKQEKNRKGETFDYRWRYWVFMLLLYHGARPGEICQLYTEDIGEERGSRIPCIFIGEGEGEKSVKTDGSRRITPIHPALIADGFLDYVADRRRRREKQLFALTPHARNGYAHAAGKWFRDYVFTPLYDEKKISHRYSLADARHTWETQVNSLPLSDHERRLAARITGRAIQVQGMAQTVVSVQMKHYVTKDLPTVDKLDVLKKVKFPIP